MSFGNVVVSEEIFNGETTFNAIKLESRIVDSVKIGESVEHARGTLMNRVKWNIRKPFCRW